ncbi:MAG: trigger factor [Rickettsiales bacterium]|nr:trigger factor [Rickettsiales bacterium]
MDIKEISKNTLLNKYKITIPKKDLDLAIESKAQEITKTAKIPGFRVGKVPLNMIKSRYADEIKSELANDFIKSSVDKIVQDNNFNLAERPSITSLDFKDTELVFEIEFQLLPKMPEIDFSKIKLTKHIALPLDKDIDKSLLDLQKNNADLKPIENSSVKKDQVVLLDADASMDGKDFPEGKLRDYKLKIGSKAFIEGFEDGLVGVKADEEKILNLKFPKDYHKQEYAGKKVTFVVKVKKIFEEKLPELNDEFAKKFKLKTLSELREAMKKNAQDQLERTSKIILKKDLFDKLDDYIKVDLPEKFVQKELEFVIKTSEKEDKVALSDKGKDSSAKKKKSSDADVHEEHKKMAERRVKLGLLINDMIKKRKISISQKDLSDEVMAQLGGNPESASVLAKYYKDNPQALESLKGQILEDKVVTSILSDVDIQEKNVTPEELKILYSKTS